MLALVATLIGSGRSSQGCADFDREGCHARAALPGFCQRDWGATHCCATCSALADDPAPAAAGCQVPRQSCVSWVCEDSDGRAARPKATLPPGASCHVVAKRTAACQRCGVVDATTCAPFTDTLRTCRSDGTWSGAEPACRRFCDDTYTPPVDELPRMDWDALAAAEEPSEGARPPPKAPSAAGGRPDLTGPNLAGPDLAGGGAFGGGVAPLTVVPISAPPHGSFLQSKKVDHYMSHRIDVFGQWLVMFTPKCSKKFGAGPSLHVANQYAQWLDWQGTGTPNNPKVWAALKNYNVTMVMFETDDTHAMRKFEDKYPFDEDGPHGGLPVASAKEWMRPHDVECDETPHADPKDNSTYDNAYCEVSQQIFNLGYRAVWPECATLPAPALARTPAPLAQGKLLTWSRDVQQNFHGQEREPCRQRHGPDHR